MESQANLNEKIRPLVHCISNFEGTSYERTQDTASLPTPLFLVLHHISFYISTYHFFTTF